MQVMEAVEPRRLPRLPWFVSYLVVRLVWALVTLVLFLTIVFFFMQVWVPYSWATLSLGGGGDAYQAALEAAGLDQPLPIRYLNFMAGLARGDLGAAFTGGQVIDRIRDAIPVTLTVFLAGTILGWVVGEVLGRLGSWRQRRGSASVISTIGVLSVTLFPPFLVFVLVQWLRRPLLELREIIGLPVDSLDLWRDAVIGVPGAVTPNDVKWLFALSLMAALGIGLYVRAYGRRHQLGLVEALGLPVTLAGVVVGLLVTGLGPRALDLLYRSDIAATTGRGSPALAILGVALISFGPVMFLMRAGMDAERSEDYVLTARAKGLKERAVRDRHVARNVMGPVLAGSFATFPTVLGGMIIVEYELVRDPYFSGGIQPQGLSTVLFSAIEFQDVPLIMGVLVVLGILGVGLRLVTDVAIAMLDPRQRQPRA